MTQHDPARIDDSARASVVLARLRAGETLVYQGPWAGALRLQGALARRSAPNEARWAALPARERFHRLRAAKLDQHRVLARLKVALDAGGAPLLTAAPPLVDALRHAFGAPAPLIELRELIGAQGAFEWYRSGLVVRGLPGKLHVWHGVYAPTRQIVAELVLDAIERRSVAGRAVLDLGTGSGVLGLLAAAAGATSVLATDVSERAVACAKENATRLSLSDRFHTELRGDWPEARFDRVLCNPPWLPAAARTELDRAVYDPDHALLRSLLDGLGAHLMPAGELWLVTSDFAARLGLEEPELVERWCEERGLAVLERVERAASHPRAQDASASFAHERAEERVALRVIAPR